MVSQFYEPVYIAHVTTNECGQVSVHSGDLSHKAEYRPLLEGDCEDILPYVNI